MRRIGGEPRIQKKSVGGSVRPQGRETQTGTATTVQGFVGASKTSAEDVKSAVLLQGDASSKAAGAQSAFAQRLNAREQSVPVRARPGVDYPVEVEWKGRALAFTVRVDEAVCKLLDAEGLRLDVQRGALIKADGGVAFTLGHGDLYRGAGRGEPPPWVLRDAVTGEFILPTSAIELVVPAPGQISWTTIDVTLIDYTVGHDDFERSDGAPLVFRRGGPAIDESALALKETVATKIDIVAPNESAMALAKQAFEAVCGKAVKSWPERRAALVKKEADIRMLARELDGAKPDQLADVVARAKELTGVDSEDRQTLLSSVRALRAQVYEQLLPVEIQVVPGDAHFFQMPAFEEVRSVEDPQLRLRFETPDLAVVMTPGKRLIYLSEADLERAIQGMSRHELYHLLESVLLDESVVARITELHARVVDAGGPFPRRYGVLRNEFLTTCGEEFENEWKSCGPGWLKAEHPEMYELLCEHTGRSPV